MNPRITQAQATDILNKYFKCNDFGQTWKFIKYVNNGLLRFEHKLWHPDIDYLKDMYEVINNKMPKEDFYKKHPQTGFNGRYVLVSGMCFISDNEESLYKCLKRFLRFDMFEIESFEYNSRLYYIGWD